MRRLIFVVRMREDGRRRRWRGVFLGATGALGAGQREPRQQDAAGSQAVPSYGLAAKLAWQSGVRLAVVWHPRPYSSLLLSGIDGRKGLGTKCFGFIDALGCQVALYITSPCSAFAPQETERLDQLSSQSDCLAIDSQSTVSGSADSSFPPLTSRPCPRCLSANTRHANWCTECGTALISTTEGGSPPVVKAINSESDLSTTPTHYKLLCGEVDTQNEDSQAEIKDGVSHDYDCFLLNTSGNVRPKSGHICTSQSSLLNVPNTKTRHAGKTSHSKRVHNTPSSSPLLTKDSPTNFSRAKSEPMAYQRRWQSSAAVYHWRNPSSLVKASPHNVAAHAVPSSAVVEKPSPSVCEFRRSSAVQKVEIPSLDLSVVEPCCSEIATTRSTAHSTDELYHTEVRTCMILYYVWLYNTCM